MYYLGSRWRGSIKNWLDFRLSDMNKQSDRWQGKNQLRNNSVEGVYEWQYNVTNVNLVQVQAMLLASPSSLSPTWVKLKSSKFIRILQIKVKWIKEGRIINAQPKCDQNQGREREHKLIGNCCPFIWLGGSGRLHLTLFYLNIGYPDLISSFSPVLWNDRLIERETII